MFSRRDRGSRGGGVLVLVKSSLRCSQVSTDTDSELVAVDILSEGLAFRLLVAYSPGTGSSDVQRKDMESLVSTMEKLCGSEMPSIILGDFNCPNVRWGSDSPTEDCTHREKMLYDFVILNGMMEQKVKTPTRPCSRNILDLVMCPGEMVREEDVVFLPSPVQTDHLAVRVTLMVAAEEHQQREILRDWRRADYNAIVEVLLEADWSDLLSGAASVDHMYGIFIERHFSIIGGLVSDVASRKRRDIQTSIDRLLVVIEKCRDPLLLEKLQGNLKKSLLRQRAIL